MVKKDDPIVYYWAAKTKVHLLDKWSPIAGVAVRDASEKGVGMYSVQGSENELKAFHNLYKEYLSGADKGEGIQYKS